MEAHYIRQLIEDDFIISKSIRPGFLSVIYEVPKSLQKQIKRNKKILRYKQFGAQFYDDVLMFDFKIPCKCKDCFDLLVEQKLINPRADSPSEEISTCWPGAH